MARFGVFVSSFPRKKAIIGLIVLARPALARPTKSNRIETPHSSSVDPSLFESPAYGQPVPA
jgi:hypothetical protein